RAARGGAMFGILPPVTPPERDALAREGPPLMSSIATRSAIARESDPQLARRYQTSGDPSVREALILRHTGLARSIARRYAGRGLAYEDILQTGYMGLIGAVDRYDPDRGVPLHAYAARVIEGEI